MVIVEKLSWILLPLDFLKNQNIYILKYFQLYKSNNAKSVLEIHENSRDNRENAFNKLCELIEEHKGFRSRNSFTHWYHNLITFKSFRETPKYIIIFIMQRIRRLYLEEGKKFFEEGRIENINDIFNYNMFDIRAALDNPDLDFKKLGDFNMSIYRKIESLKMDNPKVIDSRGKIYRAPTPKLKENEIIGFPVSGGCVTARVKVLNSPDEKPLYPGEILVARATNPGWTPLFVNASAIILEVGGLLQHGSLVAREYGKPCIVGIEHATTLFKDGQLIELDGSTGIIRLIKEDEIDYVN